MDVNQFILPYILSFIAGKPNRCDDVDNILDQLIDEFPNENPYELKKELDDVLEMAESLGIISVGSETLNKNLKLKRKRSKNNGKKTTMKPKKSKSRVILPIKEGLQYQYYVMKPKINESKLSSASGRHKRRSPLVRRRVSRTSR